MLKACVCSFNFHVKNPIHAKHSENRKQSRFASSRTSKTVYTIKIIMWLGEFQNFQLEFINYSEYKRLLGYLVKLKNILTSLGKKKKL